MKRVPPGALLRHVIYGRASRVNRVPDIAADAPNGVGTSRKHHGAGEKSCEESVAAGH